MKYTTEQRTPNTIDITAVDDEGNPIKTVTFFLMASPTRLFGERQPPIEKEQTMSWLLQNYEAILVALTSVVTAASAIANLTPTDSDNKVVAFITKVINSFALNFKKQEQTLCKNFTELSVLTQNP